MDKQNSSDSLSRSNPSEWVELHGDALFAFALKIVKDSSVAEDIVQETLLAALKARANFAGRSSERTWLISILKNKLIDHLRKQSHVVELEQPDQFINSVDLDYISTGWFQGSWTSGREPNRWSFDVDDPVEREQFWNYLQLCLNRLDRRMAKVYSMRDMMEIEFEEVCNLLKVTPSNLRVMLHRARKSLRHCLETQWLETDKQD